MVVLRTVIKLKQFYFGFKVVLRTFLKQFHTKILLSKQSIGFFFRKSDQTFFNGIQPFCFKIVLKENGFLLWNMYEFQTGNAYRIVSESRELFF